MKAAPKLRAVPAVIPDRVIRFAELCQIVGLKRSAMWEVLAQPDFPQRIRLTERAVGWRLSEVMAWLDRRERVA